MSSLSHISFFFFFNDTATTEIYTLSLHDALPIWIRNRWLATETRANNRSGCFFGKCRQVRNGFGQSGRKILRHNVFKPCQFDHSLVQSKRRHGRPVEILCYFIISNHHHLSVWPREVYGSNPISRGEQAVLPGQSGQNLESSFGIVTIAWLVGVSMHPQ